MSRLVIIGNGFDIAHGLKTSYKDLMEFILCQKNPLDFRSNNVGKCGLLHHTFKNEENPYIGFLYENGKYKFSTCRDNPSFYFLRLFEDFNLYNNWADLESLYFKLISEHLTVKSRINLINKEFDLLKEILEDYLYNQIESKLEGFSPLINNAIETFNLDTDSLIGIINFNYTKKIINYYTSNLHRFGNKQLLNNFKLINIHGELQSKENPIIFGYGDDNSSDYKVIQGAHNDELLKNFKTFQYLRNSNYIQALALLETETNIKVEIIGHSCGLADKTLLKTIFEHPNVSRIEYRYHSDESHYFTNLYNISRIFTDNELMRKKVIDLKNTRIFGVNKLVLSK